MIITIPIKNQKDIGTPSDSVVVLGYFDGIHKGHQELFRVANKAARKDLLPIVVMTFNESPKIALEPYHPDLFLHILNPAERERTLKR
ncbi:adenylyltransferase/cytidyltransferase family protein, partial [Streptococcus pneumoniae]|nr:adenylyltransferase/cytidyltransferase family protein [Streptococcus pneumoniae]